MLSIMLSLLAAFPLSSALGSRAPCSQATFTINSDADATALSQCSTLDGNVQLGTSITSIDLTGPETINGDLTVDNGNAISLQSTSIKIITGALSISNATLLSTLALSSLTRVGTLEIQTAPALSELNFGSGITSAETVHIEDTFLSSLNGLALTQVVDLSLRNNRRLRSADLPLVNVTGTLSFINNGQSFQLELPGLMSVKDFYISNITVIALPSLQNVAGAMRINSNYFKTMSVPDLHTCGNGLAIVNNDVLEDINFPQLGSIIGSLVLANNTELDSIDGINGLKTISENVDLRGNFSNVTLPSEISIGGDLNVSSSDNITDVCETLQKLAPVSQGGGGQVHGTFNCVSNNEIIDPNNPTTTTTSSSSSITSTSSYSVSAPTTTTPTSVDNATATSSATTTPSSAGCKARSKPSRYGVYLAILTLAAFV